MLKETLFRFLIGGTVVSAFAAFGDMVKPKSFAGLFGAAPSVALATLGLAVGLESRSYAATEARSMTLGALAFLIYASGVSWVMMRYQWRALVAATALILVWLSAAFAFWLIFLG